MEQEINHNKAHAHAFEILAKMLPEMIEARGKSFRIKERIAGQLGFITRKVAEHLGVEVCTIFLLEQQIEINETQLVLAEAFGYDENAIGTRKLSDKGITAVIAEGLSSRSADKKRKEVVCNFTVQDHPEWEGQLDGDLPGHGWTLLGMPIVGAKGNARGVIKLENKKSHSHSEQVGSLLSAMACRVNTACHDPPGHA